MTTAQLAIAEGRRADVQIEELAERQEANGLPLAVTAKVPYSVLQKVVEAAPAPRRPTRTRPIMLPEVTDELAAWEAASDEAWGTIE